MNGIGDSILNLPALRALATFFQGELTLLCGASAHAHVFRELRLRALVTTAVTASEPTRKRFDAPAALRAIDACDLFVSLVPWHSCDIDTLLRAWRPNRSVGFDATFDVPLRRDYTKHSAHLAFDAVTTLWPQACFASFLGAPAFDAQARDIAAGLLAALPGNMKCMVVHADTHPSKMWPPDRLAIVLDTFLNRHDDHFCFVVGSQDVGLAASVCTDRIISTIGLPLAAAQCLVAHADLFLGVDSCHLHMADFAAVPSVGLFGPTDAHEFGFLVAPHVAIQASGHMMAIEVADVLAALERVIQAPAASFMLRVGKGPHVAAPPA
jgi:ADP-heptose:LPS heptosyltransferase